MTIRFLLSGSECRMNENERDKMDSEIQDFLVSCADQIRRVHKLYNEQSMSLHDNSLFIIFFMFLHSFICHIDEPGTHP